VSDQVLSEISSVHLRFIIYTSFIHRNR